MVKLVYKPPFNKEMTSRRTLHTVDDVNNLIKVCAQYTRASLIKGNEVLDVNMDGHIVTTLYGKQKDILQWASGSPVDSSLLGIRILDEGQ